MNSEKSISIIVLSSLLGLVVYQDIAIKKYTSAALALSYKNRHLSEYVSKSFDVYSVGAMIETLGMCPPDDSRNAVSIYLGAGVCRACFSSLIVELCNAKLSDSKVIVYSSDYVQEIKAECDSHGLFFCATDIDYPLTDDILVCKYDSNHSLSAMRYDVGSTFELSLFLKR